MVWKLEREKDYLAIVSSVIVDECKRKKFEVNIKPIYIQLFFYFCFSMYLSLWNEMGHAYRQFDTFSNGLSFQPSQDPNQILLFGEYRIKRG